MAYFGFGTKENRLAWALIAGFVLLGAAFWIPGVLQYKKCLNSYSRCVCTSGTVPTSEALRSGQVRCLDPARATDKAAAVACAESLQRCRRGPIIIWSLGWLFLVVFTWIPCFYFCCCARNPKDAYAGGAVVYGQQQDALQMAPVAHPAQHYTTQPYAAQPYAAMPYSYPAPPNASAAAAAGYPAYPAGGPSPGWPADGQQQQQQQPAGGVPVHRY